MAGDEGAGRAIGEAIRQARKSRGMSQLELSSRIQRRQATISDWESGRTMPGINDLYDIAAVLDVEVYQFLPARLTDPPRAITRAIDQQLPLGKSFRGSLDLFLRVAAMSPTPDPSYEPSSSDPIQIADDLRRFAGVTGPPVDVIGLAGLAGTRVIGWDAMDDALSGLLVTLDEGPLIVFNSTHPPERNRFTVAHELGHLLLDHIKTFHVDLTTQEAGEARPGYNRSHEKAANAFAANLLMPEEWIRALEEPIDLEASAGRFQVSEIALGYRLMALDLR